MWEKVRENGIEYGTYVCLYWVSFLVSMRGNDYLSGGILIAEAIFLYLRWYKKDRNPVDMRGLFSLAWVGGQGIACLKLSKLQTDWPVRTWLCFFLAFLGFGIGYMIFREEKNGENRRGKIQKDEAKAGRLLAGIVLLAAVSAVCFLIEMFIVGFVPLFSDEPHAYSFFHVSGVHYFTVSCVLIPALTVLYFRITESFSKFQKAALLLSNLIAAAIPVLCVSRFQLLFAVGFALVVYILVYRKVKLRMILLTAAVMVPAYVLLTVARNHDVAYLNGIFEMKNSRTPIFITQPYIYVANNFENFNCLVEQLPAYAHGLRMLFPAVALTGLKFLFPQLTPGTVYLTKPELTTLTMFYDAYYDFGIPGVFLLAVLVGAAAKRIAESIKKDGSIVGYLVYGQMAIYLGLAFFTTWFSNPTTWFWFGMTALLYLLISWDEVKTKIKKAAERK